jgi:phosphatidylethanolamine/phosphatidyl-N-methylethanolamine N-methyltransferase
MPLQKVRLYDESAATYHRRYHLIQQAKYQALALYLQEGPILDVGIGTGIGLPIVRKFHPVVGIDGSIEMLRVAHDLVTADEPVFADVCLVCGEATSLPFRAGCFPTVVSVTVLQNLSNAQQGVQELVSATRLGGLLAITALERVLPLHQLETYAIRRTTLVKRLADLSNEDSGLILRRIS